MSYSSSHKVAVCAAVVFTTLPAGIESCVFCDVWSGKRPWTDALNPMNLFSKNGMTPRREKVASGRRVLPPPPNFGKMKLNNMGLEDYDYGLGLGLGLGLSDYDYDYDLGNGRLGRNGKVGRGKGGVGGGGGVRGGRGRGASKSGKQPSSALYDLYDYDIYGMDDYYDDYGEVSGKGGQLFESDINVAGIPKSPSWNGKKHENPTQIWPTWAQHSSKPNMFQNLRGHLQTTAARGGGGGGGGSARNSGAGEDAGAAIVGVGLGNSARETDGSIHELPSRAPALGPGNNYRSGGGGGNGGLTFRKGNEPNGGGGGGSGESRFRGSGFDAVSGVADGGNVSRMRRLQQQQRLLQQQKRRLNLQRQRQRGKPGCSTCGGGSLFSAASNTHEVRAEAPIWHDDAVASASEDASLEDAVASASDDHGLRRRRQNDASDPNGWRTQPAAAAADGYSRAPRPTTSCVCRCDCCPCCPCDSGANIEFIYVDE